MAKIGFADESGTDDRSVCYAIGVVSLPAVCLPAFDARIEALKRTHGVEGEPKWTRVRTSHGLVNFALDCLHLIISEPSFSFDVIVVNKRQYRNWQGTSLDRETAFYQTYTFLLRHIVRRASDMDVFIDNRSDRYGKHDEVVQTVGNRMLARLAATGRLGSVKKADSASTAGIQVADLLTGAVNTAHQCRLCPTFRVHSGKHAAIQRLASMLGWTNLAHDTYPHPKFNVWHFPTEFRGPSRDPVFRADVPYVCADDLRQL
jgi:hypothetical protein